MSQLAGTKLFNFLKQKIMKKLLTFSIAFIMAIGCFAQPPAAPPAGSKAGMVKAKQVNKPAAYACPKCCSISKEGGKCDHCQVDKVQLGSYYCMHCMKSTGNKPGKCESCKMATTQITRKYCAAHKMKHEDKKMEGDHDKMKGDK